MTNSNTLFDTNTNNNKFITVKIDKNFLKNIDNIMNNVYREVSYKCDLYFSNEEKKHIKANTLDLVNNTFKAFCSYNVSFITDLETLNIEKFKYDKKTNTVILLNSIHKNKPILIDNIEKQINKFLLDDIFTAALLVSIGFTNKKLRN